MGAEAAGLRSSEGRIKKHQLTTSRVINACQRWLRSHARSSGLEGYSIRILGILFAIMSRTCRSVNCDSTSMLSSGASARQTELESRMTTEYSTLSFVLMISILYGTNLQSLRAQVAPSAFKSSLSLSAGGMASAFQFRDVGDVRDRTGGVGGYVDLTVRHGVGVEAEGRWQRFYVWQGIHRDNYLIGPRMQFRPLWRTGPYLKVLGGFTDIGFGTHGGSGRYGTVALGGGLDFRLARRVNVRILDAEYQIQRWPASLGPHSMPYGVSVGIAYRIF